MNVNETDMELLTRYAREQVEEAFAEIVRRHLDLVFSVALRQTGSRSLAEEAAQSVFTDLARQAAKLAPGTILTAWLYRVTRHTAIDLVRRESRRQRREEELAMELSAMDNPNADWSKIEPILDEGMEALEDRDRSAVLLRYFEDKSLREIGVALGTTEEGARKRVSRSVDKLREFLGRRGVTVGTNALAAALAANAVQGAPIGLGASVVSAALTGGGLTAAPAFTATGVIAMTTLQKTIITAALVAAAGTGLYQTYNVSRLKEEVRTLHARREPLAGEISKLQGERDRSREALVAAEKNLAQLRAGQNEAEVLRLRGKVGTIQSQLSASEAKHNEPAMLKMLNDPAAKEYMQRAMAEKFTSMYGPLFEELKLDPEGVQKFVQIMIEHASKSLSGLTASAEGSRQTAAAAMQETGRQLRELLGEAGLARFQDFSLEIPARTTVTMLQGNLGSDQLSAEQSARLLTVIKAEPHELTQGIIGSPDPAFSGSEADAEGFLQKVAESNSRVLNQAGAFLNPSQLGALNTVLTNGIQARKAQAAAFFPKR